MTVIEKITLEISNSADIILAPLNQTVRNASSNRATYFHSPELNDEAEKLIDQIERSAQEHLNINDDLNSWRQNISETQNGSPFI